MVAMGFALLMATTRRTHLQPAEPGHLLHWAPFRITFHSRKEKCRQFPGM